MKVIILLQDTYRRDEDRVGELEVEVDDDSVPGLRGRCFVVTSRIEGVRIQEVCKIAAPYKTSTGWVARASRQEILVSGAITWKK